MNMKQKIPHHPCANKCTDFKGEACKTCLVSESNYVKGDVVVYRNYELPDALMAVKSAQTHSVMLDGSHKLVMDHLIRLARPAELKAKRRLPDNMLLATVDDASLYLQRALHAQGWVT